MSLSGEGQWEELNQTVKRLQDALMAMKYASRPIVAAPFGMTLGGGCEICLHSNAVSAAGETYMGLVEAGVGLIPGGGGHKELLIRATENLPEGRFDPDLFINTVFQTIAMAKVSTSGPDAQKLGLMRKTDRISSSPDYLINDAKQMVLEMNRSGYKPRQPQKIRVAGEKGFALLKLKLWSMLKGGFITEHDAKVGLKAAVVICGGAIPAGSMVTEQYLLDIEREAFLSLCGEMKTRERMQHMLTTGKPLRN
jgi:3-hydroxyacyl-CoA dehydrogenase